MTTKVTLEQVEQLATQLPPQEQLTLLSRLSARLTETLSSPTRVSKRERRQEVAAILRACDRAAAAFTRKTDAAETIRRIRDERHRQICQNES
jgi:hypothetical protein